MSKRKKLACLVTGVPRGVSRCMPTVRRLLDDYEVDYYAVLRQEFVTPQLTEQLTQLLPGVVLIVVPTAETERALAAFEQMDPRPSQTVTQMWHEVWYAVKNIPEMEKYDLFLRTRFDLYFAPQYLPDVETPDHVALIPERFNWSGSNDMVCLGSPMAFRKYANVFGNLPTLGGQGTRNPEHLVAQSLYLEELTERPLDVSFFLFREPLHDAFDDAALDVLSFLPMGLKVFKFDPKSKQLEFRDGVPDEIAEQTELERRFPVFASPFVANLYKPEIDERDGQVFRYVDRHFYLRRALKNVCGIRFKVHYAAKRWTTSFLTVTVDGVRVAMSVVDVDRYGRPTLYGAFDPIPRFQRPWSKVGISAGGSRPHPDRRNLNDKRTVSIGIGLPEFEVVPYPGSERPGEERMFRSFVSPATDSRARPANAGKAGWWRKLVRMIGRMLPWPW